RGDIAPGERLLELLRKPIGVERGRRNQIEPSRRPRLALHHVYLPGTSSSSFPRKRESGATSQQIIALDPRFRGGDGQPIPASVSVASVFALIDLNDLVEHGQGLLLRPLEGVAADDRAVGAAVADRAHLGEDAVEVLRLAARKDDDAPAVKGGLHDM